MEHHRGHWSSLLLLRGAGGGRGGAGCCGVRRGTFPALLANSDLIFGRPNHAGSTFCLLGGRTSENRFLFLVAISTNKKFLLVRAILDNNLFFSTFFSLLLLLLLLNTDHSRTLALLRVRRHLYVQNKRELNFFQDGIWAKKMLDNLEWKWSLLPWSWMTGGRASRWRRRRRGRESCARWQSRRRRSTFARGLGQMGLRKRHRCDLT